MQLRSSLIVDELTFDEQPPRSRMNTETLQPGTEYLVVAQFNVPNPGARVQRDVPPRPYAAYRAALRLWHGWLEFVAGIQGQGAGCFVQHLGIGRGVQPAREESGRRRSVAITEERQTVEAI
jgi:hypothetical protein